MLLVLIILMQHNGTVLQNTYFKFNVLFISYNILYEIIIKIQIIFILFYCYQYIFIIFVTFI